MEALKKARGNSTATAIQELKERFDSDAAEKDAQIAQLKEQLIAAERGIAEGEDAVQEVDRLAGYAADQEETKELLQQQVADLNQQLFEAQSKMLTSAQELTLLKASTQTIADLGAASSTTAYMEGLLNELSGYRKEVAKIGELNRNMEAVKSELTIVKEELENAQAYADRTKARCDELTGEAVAAQQELAMAEKERGDDSPHLTLTLSLVLVVQAWWQICNWKSRI